MRLDIVQVGEPVLRQAGKSPGAWRNRRSRDPAADRTDARNHAPRPGVGLAAPQIGLSLQLAVIEDTAESAATERTPVPFHVIANPRLELGDEFVEFYEGCLSVEGFQAIVPRARAVRVHALDHRGEPVVIDASRLVRAHPAARDRSPGRHALHRQDAIANDVDGAQLLALLGGRADRRRPGDAGENERDVTATWPLLLAAGAGRHDAGARRVRLRVAPAARRRPATRRRPRPPPPAAAPPAPPRRRHRARRRRWPPWSTPFRLSLTYVHVLHEDGELANPDIATNAVGIDMAFPSNTYVRNHLGLAHQWESARRLFGARLPHRSDLARLPDPAASQSTFRLDLEPILTVVRGEIMFVDGGERFLRVESGFSLELSATVRRWFLAVQRWDRLPLLDLRRRRVGDRLRPRLPAARGHRPRILTPGTCRGGRCPCT